MLMKIEKIEVFGYGKWNDAQFTLTDQNLQIIYGSNESGKTTLLSLIKGILFGFYDGRNTYQQYLPKDTNKYGGKLTIRTSQNHHFIITRTSGTHGGQLSIFDLDQNVDCDTAILNDLLGPIDKDTFNNLFYFGNLNLKEIAKISDNELVNRIQRVGFSGSDMWIKVRDKLDKQAKNLYAPTGRKPELNQKLKIYDQLVAKINDHEAVFQQYDKLLKQRDKYQIQLAKLQHEMDTITTKVDHLRILKQAWPIYEKINNLKNITVKNGFTELDATELNDINYQLQAIKQQLSNTKIKAKQLELTDADQQLADKFTIHQQLVQSLQTQLSEMNELITQLQVASQTIKAIKGQHQSTTLANPIDIEQLKLLLPYLNQDSNVLPIRWLKVTILVLMIGFLLRVFPSVTLIQQMGSGIFILSIFSIIGELIWHQYQVKQQTQKANKAKVTIQSILQKYQIPLNQINDWMVKQKHLHEHSDNYEQDEQFYARQIENLNSQLKAYFTQWSEIIKINHSASFKEQFNQVQQFLNQVHKIKNTQANINQNLHLQNKLLKQQQAINEKQHNFLESRHVHSIEEFKRNQQLQSDNQVKVNELTNLKNQISSENIKELTKMQSQAKLLDILNQAVIRRKNCQNHLLKLNQEIAQLNIKIEHLVSDGTYSDLMQQKDNLETEIIALSDQWVTLKLSSNWINQSLNISTKDRIPLFQAKAEKFFTILTHHQYIKLTYYKNKLKVTRHDKVKFEVGELSRGTIEQLYLALILALASVFGRDYQLPLIIDDGLTDFDSDRTKQAIQLLNNISTDIQVIYATCDIHVKSLIANQHQILNLDDY
jgi:uncharacterized protein YhaN